MRIYLDHAATTPMLPSAREAMIEALDLVGNPSSIHSNGQAARRLVEEARERVAASLGCDPIEVVFTSGGTESVNLAIKGLFWERNKREIGSALPRPRILVPRGEHHATIDAVEWLQEQEGAIVHWLPIDETGRLELPALAEALTAHDDIALLSLLWANNEVGTLQPVAEAARMAEAYGIPVHSDAVAAYGQVPIHFRESGLAALSVSAHKIGGPLGIGALVLARAATVTPLVHGGGQQRRLRSGTQDAPAAAGFAAAAQFTAAHLVESESMPQLTALRDRLIAGVQAAVPQAVLRGDPVNRLPGNAHFTFPGCEGDSLLFLLDAAGLSVSTGSACQAGIPEASHVLLGMGLTEPEARGALRFTLGHTSTDEDMDALLAALPDAVTRATRAGYSDRAVG